MLSSGPSKTVKDFYMACNAGDYTKAETYLASDVKSVISSGLGSAIGGTKTLCQLSTKDGTVSSIDVKSEQINGDSAQVTIVIHYKDNTTKEDSGSLVKEKDGWKLGAGH